MVEIFEALAVHHASRNQDTQLQDRDGELVEGHLLQGLDQMVQEIQSVSLHKHTTDMGGQGGEAGWPAGSQGLSPENSVLGATHCAWRAAAVQQVLVQ